MSDDEYTQALGTDTMEDAHEPGGAAPDDAADPSDRWEEGGAGEVVRGKARIPRTEATRKALAEAITKFKAEKTPEDDIGDFGPTDDEPAPAREKPSPVVASGEQAPAKVEPATAAPATPPAPSLDPEVTRLRQSLTADREAFQKERETFEKERSAAGEAHDYEKYLESSTGTYRAWLESMRGEKLTDEEFHQEAADFVTLMSNKVLGVKLPDEVLSRIESQLARKSVNAYKKNETRKQAAESSKREAERVQREWDDARAALNGQFRTEETSKAYPWLAAEDSPGTIIVDVIQSAQRRDGTALSWKEASKQANDYLQKQASGYFDKRKHLLSAAPVEKPTSAPTKQPVAVSGKTPGPSQVQTPPAAPTSEQVPVVNRNRPNSTWDKEAHRRQTRAAFRDVFKPES